MIQYTHQLKDKSYKTHLKRSKKGNKKMSDDILTFDIEVSSAFVQDGNVIPYRAGETDEFWTALTPISLCYIWQFSFNDEVYYGRDLYEFMEVLNDLPHSINFTIWVHNLSYEFQFLRNILNFKEVFARTKRKPIYAVPDDFTNITFRCSYMLTRLSLAAWGEQIGTHKKTGDLDYQALRTPKTVLTEKELTYCEYDCRVVYEGIKTYVKQYDYQENIPLTQTGTVRRVVKKLLWSKDYRHFIEKLLPRDATEYKRLRDAFAGGYTHANAYYSDETIKGHIEHYDFTSSYPTVMACEKFPMTPWTYVPDKLEPTEAEAENAAFLLEVEFDNIQAQTQNSYIQAAKCRELKTPEYDNGRIRSAEHLVIWITEQDFFIIRDTYTWGRCIIKKKYKSIKDYLPKKFIEYILELYENKTKLKGVKGEEELYLQSKQYINSLYGMMVTAFIQSEVSFDNVEWKETAITDWDVNKKINELLAKFWDDTYFLSYSWGVWVTAYARRNLWKCMIPYDVKVIYSDTDSIFLDGHGDFTEYNNEITDKLRTMCNHYDIDFDRTRPKTIKGVEKPLGIFDRESDCTEFRTLGAKRYVERRPDGKLYLTVSGVNKEAVSCLNGNIESFKEGIIFDKDSGSYDENGKKVGMHKNLCTYCDNQPVIKYPDGYVSGYQYGTNLRPTGYKLTMSDDYKDLIERLDKPFDDFPEEIQLIFKSKFTMTQKGVTL